MSRVRKGEITRGDNARRKIAKTLRPLKKQMGAPVEFGGYEVETEDAQDILGVRIFVASERRMVPPLENEMEWSLATLALKLSLY